MQRCRWEKGCLNAPGLPAARSLLDSWRVRCEVPGRLWLGVTSPDQACPCRRAGVWHCRRFVAQMCRSSDIQIAELVRVLRHDQSPARDADDFKMFSSKTACHGP